MNRKHPPSKDEAVARLRAINGDDEKINEWNALRKSHPDWCPDLSRADLQDANLTIKSRLQSGIKINLRHTDFTRAQLDRVDLTGADLHEATFVDARMESVNLTAAILSQANLTNADCIFADLHHAICNYADFSYVRLCSADLRDACLIQTSFQYAELPGANCLGADLFEANLEHAELIDVNFSQATLSSADLSHANLFHAIFHGTNLANTRFKLSRIFATTFSGVDLSRTKDLQFVQPSGPCTIGLDTLELSRGKIPEAFLKKCGLSPWQVEQAKLFDPELTALQVKEIQCRVFDLRTNHPIFIGGVFISYSHKDDKFVDKLFDRLKNEGANVWLDRHDLVAGPIGKQVFEALRLQGSVVMVLSKDSVNSPWVEQELDEADKCECNENRNVLCPVALDYAWKAKVEDDDSRVLWAKVKNKNVLDFSDEDRFEQQFQKLIKGLKIYYPPASSSSDNQSI